MKRFFAIVLTLAIPALLLFAVLQSSRYVHVQTSMRDYVAEQNRIIEENKRKISALAILAKPERIEKIAIEDLKMKKILPSDILRVSFTDEGALSE